MLTKVASDHWLEQQHVRHDVYVAEREVRVHHSLLAEDALVRVCQHDALKVLAVPEAGLSLVMSYALTKGVKQRSYWMV